MERNHLTNLKNVCDVVKVYMMLINGSWSW